MFKKKEHYCPNGLKYSLKKSSPNACFICFGKKNWQTVILKLSFECSIVFMNCSASLVYLRKYRSKRIGNEEVRRGSTISKKGTWRKRLGRRKHFGTFQGGKARTCWLYQDCGCGYDNSVAIATIMVRFSTCWNDCVKYRACALRIHLYDGSIRVRFL